MNKFIMLLATGMFLFVACDKVEGPFRENAAASKGITYLSDADVVIDGDTFSFPAENSNSPRKVLAEDYTGILCGNCPYAGIRLNDTIKPAYGDRLVVISVHAGFFADPCPNGFACPGSQPAGALTTDFRTTVGNDWDNFFGNSNAGNPNALIDRVGFLAGTHIKTPSTWANTIQSRSNVAPNFALRMQSSYDPLSRNVKVAIQSRSLGIQEGIFRIQVVLTEDSVIDWQEWYPPVTPAYDPHFNHRYVLRDAVNSSFGEVLSNSGFTNGQLALRAYTANLKSAWNPANCRLVAFVYDATTYEVKQVEEIKIIP